jgi:hypothetical protein
MSVIGLEKVLKNEVPILRVLRSVPARRVSARIPPIKKAGIGRRFSGRSAIVADRLPL